MSASNAILLTAPGASAIAVIRLTGPLVPTFLKTHFSKPIPPSRCIHANLIDTGVVIDDPVVVYTPDPPTADLNLHGGPWVIQSALDLARRFGFNFVDRTSPLPPESVDADSPIEREILRYLPQARTELAVRELLSQKNAWHQFDALPAAEQRRVAPVILADQSLHWLLNPPRVAIVGPPNAGKSTLANRLFAQERSITADLPGTTRDWVGELANIDGLTVMLVDTPGLRQTPDPIERQAITRAAGEIAAADLVLLVLDLSEPIGDQRSLLDQFPTTVRVGNKCDLIPQFSADYLPVSARTDQGIDTLRLRIRDHFHVDQRPNEPKCWTDEQRRRLHEILTHAV